VWEEIAVDQAKAHHDAQMLRRNFMALKRWVLFRLLDLHPKPESETSIASD
jgi:hypothetical protein